MIWWRHETGESAMYLTTTSDDTTYQLTKSLFGCIVAFLAGFSAGTLGISLIALITGAT